MIFPEVSGVNLEGKRFELPRDFGGKLNILIVAFKREHTQLIDGWLPHLKDLVNSNKNLEYYELPTLSASYSLFRRWIDGGMRAGILDKDARERTITLYIDKARFKQQLGILNEKTIYMFLVNEGGQIIWRTEGVLTRQKLRELESVLKCARHNC